MAVDKKSQHVGDHGGAYTDMNGNRKQFTYIDHDPKTKISGHLGDSLEEINKKLAEYRSETVEYILSIPAALCPIEFQDFTVRGENQVLITWNETMLRDGGITTGRLRDLATLLGNRFQMKAL